MQTISQSGFNLIPFFLPPGALFSMQPYIGIKTLTHYRWDLCMTAVQEGLVVVSELLSCCSYFHDGIWSEWISEQWGFKETKISFIHSTHMYYTFHMP